MIQIGCCRPGMVEVTMASDLVFAADSRFPQANPVLKLQFSSCEYLER